MNPDADRLGSGEEETFQSRRSRLIFATALLFLVAVFLGLGTWQVQRLFWKLDLIERVEARVHADPAPSPEPAEWAGITAEKDEYRRIHDREVLVQAVTALGSGFWVVTPLQRADGTTILVNRGFVPEDRRDPATRTDGEVAGTVEVSGLLRITEPDGAFLRTNVPHNDRWYSRDVAAIAAAKGLANAAPYFIDADSTPNPGGLPVGGLTIIKFRNSHLIYALTWYFLAAMSAGAAYAVFRQRIG